MENINPAAKGYVENNEEENYVDNEFIKNNKECWEIIKLFSDSPFLTQEEVSKKLNFTKEQLIQQISSRNIKGNYEWNDSHGDIKPWNLIVNGSGLHLIDMNGKNHWSSSDLRTDADGLTEILNELNKT